MPNLLSDAIKSRKIGAVRAAVKADPEGASHPRYIGETAGAAFQAALEVLHANGADLNGKWRNYRPLHQLIQSDPHSTTTPTSERHACLDWMLANCADPEQLGAWPSARAIIIAAFGGRSEYVKRLRKAGAKIDGFTGAALGERKAVEKALAAQPGFALERDGGLLTALQCAAGSRLAGVDTLSIARLLLDAGAEVDAKTKSWGDEVNAAYFAAGTNSKPMFELLLSRGADPTEAISHAVWGKHYELAELALSHGARLDRALANSKPLLNDLIRWGQIPQMEWMLAHGASPNIPDDQEGWTAVHQSASRGNARIMRAVLDAGGDLTIRDQKGWMPIDLAKFALRDKLIPMMANET